MPVFTHADAVDWYWKGVVDSQTVVFGSARNGVVSDPVHDASFQAWLNKWSRADAAPWPKAEDGSLSYASLDEALAFYGLPPSGLGPVDKGRLNAYAWSKATALLATSRNYAVAGVGTISCDAEVSSSNLLSISSWGARFPAATQQWTDNAYNVFTITGDQAVAFADAVLTYGKSIYDELATAASGVGAGTITSFAQIDALAWPV